MYNIPRGIFFLIFVLKIYDLRIGSIYHLKIITKVSHARICIYFKMKIINEFLCDHKSRQKITKGWSTFLSTLKVFYLIK